MIKPYDIVGPGPCEHGCTEVTGKLTKRGQRFCSPECAECETGLGEPCSEECREQRAEDEERK